MDEWDEEETSPVNSRFKSHGQNDMNDVTDSVSAFSLNSSSKSFGGRKMTCHKCQEEGHMSRECPNNSGGGGSRDPVKCYKCQEEGHMSRECPNNSGGGGSRDPVKCYKCNETGHMSRDCTNSSAGDDKPKTCFKCKEEGHFSRECPNADSNQSGPRKCFKCKEEGHMSSECPEGGSSSECFKCHQEGHMARDCPNPPPEDPDKPPAMTYVPAELDNDELFSQGVNIGINFNTNDNIPVQSTGEDVPPPVTNFRDCGLREILLNNISKAKYEKPTPIQKHSLPVIMKGRDLMACAQTGSGKTAAFLLPVLHYILENNIESHSFEEKAKPTGLVMTPTRELAIQIFNEARKFSSGSVIKTCLVYGGTSVSHQQRAMQNGCHVLVATPGRLLDFVERGWITFDDLKYLILDEADRMLDLGFAETIKKVVNHPSCPKTGERQTLMFSATFPTEVQKMATQYLSNYVFTVVGIVGGANVDVRQIIENVCDGDKRETLLTFLTEHTKNNPDDKILVFVNTKKKADFIACYLSTQKVSSTSIHGDRFQSQREEALSQFKNGIRNVLVATAVAARGLDIKGVGCVVNYDMPDDIQEYVHRIGRTGRVGNQGIAVSYFDTDSNSNVAKDLVKILSDADQEVPDWLLACANSSCGTMQYGKRGFGAKDVRGYKGGDDSAEAAFGGPNPQSTEGQGLVDDEDWG